MTSRPLHQVLLDIGILQEQTQEGLALMITLRLKSSLQIPSTVKYPR